MAIGELERGRLRELASAAFSGTDRDCMASEFLQAIHKLERAEGRSIRERTLRMLLTELVRQNRDKIESLPYPESVQELIRAEHDRIEKACQEGTGSHWDLRYHQLRCDFRIACFGRIPVGPEHMEVDGLPRSVLYYSGFAQAVRFVKTVWAEAPRS